MRTSVIIQRKGNRYFATVQGKFGGGYSNSHAGTTPADAAAFAAAAMIDYCVRGNEEGGDLVAPPEVVALVPEHLRRIAPRREEHASHNVDEAKIVVGWSAKGREEALRMLKERVKPEYFTNEEEWVRECFNRVADRVPGRHEPGYEVAGRWSVTGNPLTIDFSDDCFEWGEPN